MYPLFDTKASFFLLMCYDVILSTQINFVIHSNKRYLLIVHFHLSLFSTLITYWRVSASRIVDSYHEHLIEILQLVCMPCSFRVDFKLMLQGYNKFHVLPYCYRYNETGNAIMRLTYLFLPGCETNN